MVYAIISCILGCSLGFLTFIIREIQENKYCNRNYNYYKDSLKLQLQVPQYEVKKVEQVYCKNNAAICVKYTLQNWHIKKKNDIEMQELYLYDEVGKYNIGDILIFSKK